MTTRETLFLVSSEKLDEIGGTGPDPVHVEVFESSQEAARQKARLTPDRIVSWAAALSPKAPAVAAHVARALLEELEGQRGEATTAVGRASLVGAALYQAHAALASCGRLARILANYYARSAGAPVLVFGPDERGLYAKAVGAILGSKALVANRIRDTIYDPFGRLLLRRKTFGTTDRYEDDEGHIVLVENQELDEAAAAWMAGRASPAPR